jgi:NAD+-processing family protein with receiver domain
MKILFLDDQKVRHTAFAHIYSNHDITHARNYTQCIISLRSDGPFDVALLDHDLGEEHTGSDVARFIASELDVCLRPKQVVIHSWNPTGARHMQQILQSVGISAVCAPFTLK